jgi:UDP-3-O-[3-hydroxymyristoyl] N-acetylglucosamine deacetylase
MNQATLRKETRALGMGLHSGKLIEMVLQPAAPDTGIVFSRTDLGGATVKAEPANIDYSALQLATTLRKGDVEIRTTEHLLSALYGMGVDNCLIEINGPEVPIMDGSSAPFLVLIEEAGIRTQPAPRKTLVITKPFHFEWNGKSISVTPHRSYKISYEINFDHPLIQRQTKTAEIGVAYYESEIAPARTFGFLKDINYLKSQGLVLGGSLDNAIVLDGERMLNESLRLSDEFVSQNPGHGGRSCHFWLASPGSFHGLQSGS